MLRRIRFATRKCRVVAARREPSDEYNPKCSDTGGLATFRFNLTTVGLVPIRYKRAASLAIHSIRRHIEVGLLAADHLGNQFPGAGAH